MQVFSHTSWVNTARYDQVPVANVWSWVHEKTLPPLHWATEKAMWGRTLPDWESEYGPSVQRQGETQWAIAPPSPKIQLSTVVKEYAATLGLLSLLHQVTITSASISTQDEQEMEVTYCTHICAGGVLRGNGVCGYASVIPHLMSKHSQMWSSSCRQCLELGPWEETETEKDHVRYIGTTNNAWTYCH